MNRHFLQRAHERLGIIQAQRFYAWILKHVNEPEKTRDKRVKSHDRQTPVRTRWVVRLDNEFFLVVHDESINELVTIIPYRPTKRSHRKGKKKKPPGG